VELNSRRFVAAALDKVVQLHRPLVKSSKVEFSPASLWAPDAIFTPAEMRHNFAVWVLKKNGKSKLPKHLYYCIRCREAFSVDDRSGCVTALDASGDPIHASDAAKRLETFGQGPCPAFGALLRPRLTRKAIPIRGQRGRVAKLLLAGSRTWRVVVGNWPRFLARSGFQKQK
jgi:hypothetical protein